MTDNQPLERPKVKVTFFHKL